MYINEVLPICYDRADYARIIFARGLHTTTNGSRHLLGDVPHHRTLLLGEFSALGSCFPPHPNMADSRLDLVLLTTDAGANVSLLWPLCDQLRVTTSLPHLLFPQTPQPSEDPHPKKRSRDASMAKLLFFNASLAFY